MTTPDPGVGGAGMSPTAHPGTWGLWHAIRAIVAVHAKFNRDHLLAQLDAAIEAARKRETEVTTVGLGGSDGRL